MAWDMDDSILQQSSEGELLNLAKLQGLGRLRVGLPRETLIAVVTGREDLKDEYLADTRFSRARLEKFIQNNWAALRSQLPGCNGKCQTWNCSEARHLMCYVPNADNLL